MRLLIVEDEPLVAFDTEHLLTEQDFVVVGTVDRVAQAIALIDEGTAIDLVLVDVNLADGSGVDVARAAFARGVAVMFVTGHFSGEGSEFARGCLIKPYDQRDLIGAIDAIEAHAAGRKVKRLPQGFRMFEKA
ncbi:response regulator [Sphingomonas oligophenolica]|uniref:response regulator n=1 Tax=Sphingomonas oligophenolica TaxID=301154 RepID=UPI0030C8ABEC